METIEEIVKQIKVLKHTSNEVGTSRLIERYLDEILQIDKLNRQYVKKLEQEIVKY